MSNVSIVPCAATGIAVPIEGEGQPEGKTIAPASACAISALYDHPEAEWAKAAVIDMAGKRRVWYAWTSQEGVPDTEFDWNHGARFATSQVKAGLGETADSVEGSIDEVLWTGVEGARVDRGDLTDEVNRLYESFKQEFQKVR